MNVVTNCNFVLFITNIELMVIENLGIESSLQILGQGSALRSFSINNIINFPFISHMFKLV